MGIPSYFSFIVKNHADIVRKIHQLNKNVDNFYLDSNSIVYDCLRALEKEYKGDDDKFEQILIESVCEKIDEYISIIKPKRRVYIAFDGVAPIAKLNQQRNRRYMSIFDEKNKNIENSSNENSSNENIYNWNKSSITPGTFFMNKLSIE